MRGPCRIVVVAAVLTACGGGRDGGVAVERRDSVGIEIVTSPGVDIPLEGRFVPEFTLGGEDSGPESFYRVAQSLVGVDDLGRIHVLDREGYRVVVFDGEGRHLWSAGREGDGPGELARPLSLLVTGDGESLVLDLADAAFEGFRHGAPTRALRLPSPYYVGRTPAMLGEDIILVRAGAGGVRNLLSITPRGDTAIVLSLQGPPPRPLDLRESCGIWTSGIPPLFAPSMDWDVRGETLMVARDGTYRVEAFVGGRLVRVVGRDLAPRPADSAAALQELGEGMIIVRPGGERRLCDPEEQVAQQGFLPQMPWIGAMRISPEGELWVQRFQLGPDATGPIDLFDPSGAYAGTLPSGTQLPLAFLPDGRVLLREVDEVTEVERIAVGRMEMRRADG